MLLRKLLKRLQRIERKYEKLPDHARVPRARLMRMYTNTQKKLRHFGLIGDTDEIQTT